MRLLLPATHLALATAACLALAACKDKAQDAASAPVDPAATSAAPAAPATPPVPPASTDTALQGDVIASTNEPSWQAHASGPVLTLRGPGSERQLAIGSSEVAGDTRTLRASDANGLVELEIVASQCQDSMSGANFPYSAVLVIDAGTPVSGCARPASMPPPGEPQ